MKNTTTRATNNQLSAIMSRAWSIKREDKNNVFSICLVMAWDEYRRGTLVQQSPAQIIAQWNVLDTAQQINYTLRMTKKVCKSLEAQTGSSIYSEWIDCYGDAQDELINTSFAKILEHLDAEKIQKSIDRKQAQVEAAIESGEPCKYHTYTLNALINKACRQGIENLYNNEIKHIKAVITSIDNEKVKNIMDQSDAINKLIDMIDLEAFKKTLDNTNALILDMLLMGKTQEEISVIIGVTQQAIAKRYKRIKDAIRETIVA